MSKGKRKRKGSTAGEKRDAAGRIPWGTIIAGLVIVAAAFAYMFLRYGAVNLPPERARDAIKKPQSTVNLYFADQQGEHLTAEQRGVVSDSSLEGRIERTVRELMRGPRGALAHTIPPATELKSVRMTGDGVAWLNFSGSLVTGHPGGSSAEIMTIYSIVNTVLLNFNEVRKVGILVEGKSIDTLAGHLDCREPFTADTTVIQ